MFFVEIEWHLRPYRAVKNRGTSARGSSWLCPSRGNCWNAPTARFDELIGQRDHDCDNGKGAMVYIWSADSASGSDIYQSIDDRHDVFRHFIFMRIWHAFITVIHSDTHHAKV